jgi:hypothetical protein
MARCDVCGNDHDLAFQVTMEGRTRTFDCFECAIHACATSCSARWAALRRRSYHAAAGRRGA